VGGGGLGGGGNTKRKMTKIMGEKSSRAKGNQRWHVAETPPMSSQEQCFPPKKRQERLLSKNWAAKRGDARASEVWLAPPGKGRRSAMVLA